MKKFLIVAGTLAISTTTFAKITIFSQEEVLEHVLKSAPFNQLLQRENLDISEVQLRTEGQEPYLHYTASFTLSQAQLGLNGPTSVPCYVQVEISMELYNVNIQPGGDSSHPGHGGGVITASRLTEPKLGPLVCAMASPRRF